MAGFGFWIAAGGLLLAAGLVLMRALRAPQLAQDAPHLSVYRDQLAEVDRDLARNVIAPEEAARLRTEVSRRLLDAAKSAPDAAHLGSSIAAPMGIVFAALAGAMGLYLWMGVPDYPDLPLQKRLAMAQESYDNRPSQAEAEAAQPVDLPAPSDPAFAALITQLREVVAQRPDDIQGLTLLARNEAGLGNFAAAGAAYRQLIKVKGDQASLDDHLGAAQAMIAAAGGMVLAEAEGHLNAALQLDPENGMAQYFLGLMMAQVGRPDRAFTLWEGLLRAGPQDALYIEPIRTMLPSLAEAAGIKYSLPLNGPSADDMANAAEMSNEDRQAMIATMVAGLEERLMQNGGSIEEWQRLINALGVLNDPARQSAARDAARAAFADDPAALDALP